MWGSSGFIWDNWNLALALEGMDVLFWLRCIFLLVRQSLNIEM